MNAYNPKVCMDTSSIVKWFKTEEGSKEALKLSGNGQKKEE